MASGHVNRTQRPNTWLHRPRRQNVKKALANSEPSTHGTSRHSPQCSDDGRYWGEADKRALTNVDQAVRRLVEGMPITATKNSALGVAAGKTVFDFIAVTHVQSLHGAVGPDRLLN
jgi:hypothetical protein